MKSIIARLKQTANDIQSLPRRMAKLEQLVDTLRATTNEFRPLPQQMAKLEQFVDALSVTTKAALAPQYDIVPPRQRQRFCAHARQSL